MKKKYLAYAALSVLGLSLAGVGIASAHGMGGFGFGFMGPNLTPYQIATAQQSRFQKMADILGISLNDVKNAWAKGESFQQLAQDHGITPTQLQQKLKDAQTAEIKSQLDTLVQKGIITQDQENQRLQFLQSLAANKKGRGHMGMMGF